jgi:DNA replication and repair protein RecF
MHIRRVRLKSFRAHASTAISFSPGVNLIVGPNGIGKTNVLEAIHYLCLSKSFLASSDNYVLRKGDEFFEVEGAFTSERGRELTARIAFVPSDGKKLFLNGAALDRLADIVGRLPIVVFSPDDYVITAGGPDERRAFLNNILSQARPAYMEDLWAYRRALKQRNELLSQFQGARFPMPEGLLESWDAELTKSGARVITERLRFLRRFDSYLAEAYGTMEHAVERPTIRYQTAVDTDALDSEEQVAAALADRFAERRKRDQETGRTGDGPHRDELVFKLNGMDVRRYASQGQHRTFGMALKLAQFFYLRDRLDETPILLLDDIFDHLDPSRTAAVLDLLSSDGVGQSIITGTRAGLFDDRIDFASDEHSLIDLTTEHNLPEGGSGTAEEAVEDRRP